METNEKRAVITGLGIVSPLGIGKEAFWDSLKAGRSGIKPITAFNASHFSCRIGGEVNDFDPAKYTDKKTIKRTDRTIQFGIAATRMAIEDAKLSIVDENPEKIGVSIGSAAGSMAYGAGEHKIFLEKGIDKISPYLAIIVFAGSISSQISIEIGLKGPSISFSTGCPSGSDAISYSLDMIRRGRIDVMICGGAEAPFSPIIFGAFDKIDALSKRNSEPERASRPFDKNRDGFVMAEGAAVLILEELEHALSRKAHVYGEILGYGTTCDAYHMTQPEPSGKQASRAIRLALEDAHIKPEQVDYINAHGTSTPLNDKTETKVIKDVFGKRAYEIPISSSKSMFGHLIGAASSMELTVCALALENNFLPPTINFETLDPECDLDYIPNVGQEVRVNYILSNSFGFGGKNTIITLGRL